MLKDYEKKLDDQRKEIKDFKDHVAIEYLDFFKNRQRIRSEMASSVKDINEKLEVNKKGNDYNRRSFEIMSKLIP